MPEQVRFETTGSSASSARALPPTGACTIASNDQSSSAISTVDQVDRDATTIAESCQTAQMPVAASTNRLKDYEILEELGRGGMGVVFKARQMSLGRQVALKMILAGEFAGATEIRRFHAEAEAAAHLDHPNIVSIYEIGEDSGRLFFSMQFIEGENLSRQVGKFQRDHRETAAVVAQIARAVHYAHQRGILHRDLKPGNVLMDEQGKPYVTDFGLAAHLQSTSEITMSGTILGTPSYMSPEQAAGRTKRLTTATDTYSLGAILFHLLAGRPPFTSDSSLGILQCVVEADPPALHTLVPDIDRDLETICLKCLEKIATARYGSAEALAEDLERWLRFEPILARPSTPWERVGKWVKRKPVTAALVLALFLVGVVGISGIVWQWLRSEGRLIRLNVANGTRLAREGDLAGALLWYTEALRLDKTGRMQEDIHRIRIGSLLEQTPQLRRVWFNDDPVWLAQLSLKQDRLAIISGKEAVANRFSDAQLRVWNFADGSLLSPRITFSGGRPYMYRIRYEVFSPDGRTVVTVRSADTPRQNIKSTLLLLDSTAWTNTVPPLKIEGLVTHVEFSPDGEFVVAAGKGGFARVWDVRQGGKAVGDFAHAAWVTTSSFSPNGHYLLTGSMDKTAKLWDFHRPVPLFTFAHGRFVLDARFSHEGQRVVTAASDPTGGEFHVWDVENGKQVCALDNGQGKVDGVLYQATFSPDDRRIVVANFDSTVTVWDAATGRPVLPPLKHNHGVLTARFAPDGRHVLSASFDTTARLWNAQTGAQAAVLNQCSYLLDASFTLDGREVVTASADGMVRAWELPREPAGEMTLAHPGNVLHAEFSHDGRFLLTAGTDHTARVWDSQTGHALCAPLQHRGAVYYATFSPDDKLIVSSSADGTARIWDVTSGKQMGEDLVHSNTVWHAEFDLQGKRVVTASGGFRRMAAASSTLLRDFSEGQGTPSEAGGQARVWDARTGRPLTEPLRHDDAVVYAGFSPDGNRIISTSADRTAQLWQLPKGTKTGQTMSHIGIVFGATFSPNGEWIVTTTGGEGSLVKGTAQLWTENGESARRTFSHGDMVYSASFSQDGRKIVTASEDGTARVWDVETGGPLTPPIVNGSIALGAVFSPDGRFVLTTSVDGAARVWDGANGELIALVRVHESRLNSAHFSPDGKRILTASDDGTAKITILPRTNEKLEDLILLAHVLSARRIVSQGTELEPLAESQFENSWSQLVKMFPNRFALSR
jgi:WD40 repeat protein/serine/threonine protein kinase